jgi:transmembrane sensor
MNRYEEYCVEDFVLDAEFQNWVRYKASSSVRFWQDYVLQFPAQAGEVDRARTLLEGVYVRYGADISDAEIESEITGLITRIREDRESVRFIATDEKGRGFVIRPLLLWLAAASVLLIGGFAAWYGLSSSSRPSYAHLVEGKSLEEKVNNTTAKQTVNLSDGSVVILEPNSRLSMPSEFSEENRTVYLSGEAYFKVTKDIDRPFLVYTNKLITRVLGTSFIVKVLKGEEETSVEVKEGKVSVFRKDDFERVTSGTKNESKGIVVTPNQKIVFEGDGSRILKMLSEAPEVVPSAKTTFKFDYRSTPVKDVLTDLKNAYQVDIIFDADLLSDCPITATLSNRPLLEKLNIICEAIEAKYEVLDGKIMIYGKSCLN